MILAIESTDKIVTVNGIPARIWEGATVDGIPCHVYVTRVAVTDAARQEEFEQQLKKCRPPTPEIAAIPARLIL